MKKFEYRVDEIPSVDGAEEAKILNERGAEGWELVQIIDHNTYGSGQTCFYFKREKN